MIESTKFSSPSDTRRELTYREIGHHPGLVDEEAISSFTILGTVSRSIILPPPIAPMLHLWFMKT